jgi:hypothetical protein
VTQINSEIDLVGLRYLALTSLVFHEDCDEFIADLRSMLSIVSEAVLL